MLRAVLRPNGVRAFRSFRIGSWGFYGRYVLQGGGEQVVLAAARLAFGGELLPEVGDLLAQLLEEDGFDVVRRVVPDERDEIAQAIVALAAGADLVLTSGGTGLAPRDVTPEATRDVIDREAPGIAEAMRAETAKLQPLSWLSRGVAGTRGRSLVVNLPGNPKAVRECLDVLAPMLPHALKLATGSDGGGAHEPRTG